MSRALFSLVIGASVCLHASAEERAFLETETPRATYYVQEPVRVTLRIGVDAEYFEKSVVQMFQRRLDLPMQVEAPWLRELAGTIIRKRGAAGGRRLTLALNDDLVQVPRAGDRQHEGRTYTVLVIARTYLPTEPGELVIPAPRLRYAYGTQFKEDFIHGRIALDRRDAFVTGTPLTLEIRALPEKGRPQGFTGAVGRSFTVLAETDSHDLEAGETFKLTLRIQGEGNLELFEAPRLSELAGDFHVYGLLDDKGAQLRTITYDLTPLHGTLTALPSMPFVYFDTTDPAAYRTIQTRSIPITVRKEPETALPPDEESPQAEQPGSLLPVLALALLLFVSVAILLWRRARRRNADLMSRDAAAEFRARAGDSGTDLAETLAEYLAARLGCPTAAVIAPELRARLAKAGIRGELADRTATLLERLVAARYGEVASNDGAEAEARSIVDKLEGAFGDLHPPI
ncbi:MAG: BatD family protein [Planctomycetota bacterium]